MSCLALPNFSFIKVLSVASQFLVSGPFRVIALQMVQK
jgi:hypothetical protein